MAQGQASVQAESPPYGVRPCLTWALAGDSGRARRSHGDSVAVPATRVTVHHPLAPMGAETNWGTNRGTNENWGTNRGTNRGKSGVLIGEFGSLYITRFGAFWQRDDVGPLT